MKIYQQKTGRKTVKGTKKLLGVMRAKRFLVFSAWFEAYSGSSMG